MKFDELIYKVLSESRNTPLISIDIQPAYEKYCSHIMTKFVNFLNSHRGEVYYFYNGSDVGIDDTAESIKYWLLEYGVNEDVIDKISFKEKTYAFFRNFMDSGMDRKEIISIIRYMVTNRLTDSRDIEDDKWKEILGNKYDEFYDLVNTDNIYLPDISFRHLKELSGCYLCGGGKDECLSEFRFLLESFNIRYTLIKSLIY
jgi:hypothetical protein